MDQYKITGGATLKGTVTVSGAKNVALKVVAAGLYTEEPIVLKNMPKIGDLDVMLEILESLGAQTSFVDHNVTIRTKHLTSNQISLEMGSKCKTGTLAFGPLLNMTGEAIIPNPGGCRIGARPIDRYIEGLTALGAEFAYEDGFYKAKAPKGLRGTRFHFIKNSHSGTETLILAAVCAKGKTIIENAAAEPEVDDLIELLNKMGGKIKRTEPRTIQIEGVSELHGAEHSIMGDRLEAQTFACAALATKGDVQILGIDWMLMSSFLDKVEESGRNYDVVRNGVRIYGDGLMKAVDITTTIHPGFITDWQQPWAVAMTQSEGVSNIHETIFENRFGYVKYLQQMGANIELYRPDVTNPESVYNFNIADDKPDNPHAAKITGPTVLHGAEVEMIDLRAGATLVIAALAATGQTTISGIHHLERGYEDFVGRIRSLGAVIEYV
jgi:UDP-N-acetylglucosamine 1-carboxyvinyltransferase